jgi:hypothetical protein
VLIWTAVVFDRYDCDPTTCLDITVGTGYFESGTTITGYWLYDGKEYPKAAGAFIISVGCTVQVTIESVGYENFEPLYWVKVSWPMLRLRREISRYFMGR